jgi:hypothetical protein
MKKFLSIFLIFVGLLISSVSKSQGLIFDNSNYNKWVQAESGSGSFFINTTTDYLIRNDGYYYFNIYFYSNAANQQGYLTSCYVENITVYLGYFDKYSNTYKWKQVVYMPYVLVQPKTNNSDGITLAAYVYSASMYQKIRVTWLSSSPY